MMFVREMVHSRPMKSFHDKIGNSTGIVPLNLPRNSTLQCGTGRYPLCLAALHEIQHVAYSYLLTLAYVC